MSQNKPLSEKQAEDLFEVNELDLEFSIDIDDFEATEIDLQNTFETRYVKPPRSKESGDKHCRYDNALKLARDIEIQKGDRYFVEVNGTFIFGDFIEALFHAKGWEAHRVVISTLSMSMNNVDSLANILNWGWSDHLDLIVSDYFYSHERQMMVPYIYEKCDINNRFQLAAARTHEKLCCIHTKCGLFVVIDGSVNLRSSGNLEQFRIEENETLFDFVTSSQNRILDEFGTINKDVPLLSQKTLNREKTWQVVAEENRKRPA